MANLPQETGADLVLEHGRWMRGLARALVHDEHEREDAIQDTWVAALEGRMRHQQAPRSWMARVLGNFAKLRLRRERGLRVREGRAARPELEETDPALVLARAELLQRVGSAVLELEEPYRSTLLLRFLEELPTDEVAGRLGVPGSTVRNRIRRGLVLLRTRLDTERDGSFLAALAPLAGPAPGALTAGVGATQTVITGTGIITMTAKLSIGIAAMVVVGVAILTWQSRGPSDSETAPTQLPAVQDPQSAGGTATDSELAAVAGAFGDEETRHEVTPASTGWVVRGQTRLLAGAVVPSTSIRAQLFAGPEASGEPLLEELLESDEKGEFEWSLTQPDGEMSLSLRADQEGYWSATSVSHVEAGGLAPEGLVIVLKPLDCILNGWVHDPAGRPVVAARVHYASFEQRTDAEGRFRLALPTSSQEIYLSAEAEGFAQKRTVVHAPADGEARTLDIELPREFRVSGRVSDEDGAPIAGAALRSFYTQGNEVITDASGRYSLGALDPGRPNHTIYAQKQGYVLAAEEIETNSRREAELNLVMRRGVRVEGRVVDENGTPLEKVGLYIGSRHVFGALDVLTDAEGRFALTEVGPGPTKLVAQLEGFAPYNQDLIVPVEWTPRMGVDIVLRPGHFIAGRVADPDGGPLEGVHIAARYRGDYLDTRATSDAEGSFRMEGLPSDDISLEFFKPGLLRLTHELERLDDDGLELTMRRSGSIAGRVVDGRSGEPLPVFRIRFVEPALEQGDQRLWGFKAEWWREGYVFTDSNGVWDTDTETLEPGAVIGIEASATGFAKSVAAHVVVSSDPDPDALVLRLFPGTTVRGQVVDARTHAPVEGALVKRFTRDNPIRHSDSDDVHDRMQVRSDAAGQFEFLHVRAGEMSLLVEHPDYSACVDGPFEVSDSSGAPDRSVALSQGSVVSGTVQAADGAPSSDQKVVLSAAGIPGFAGKQWEARTDGQGCFRFERIPNGGHSVAHVLEAGDHSVEALVREVKVEGMDMAVELRPQGSAVLRGLLSSSEELPPNLTVIVEWQGPASSVGQSAVLRGTFSRDGRFEFLGLEPGNYELQVRHRDWHQFIQYSARDQVTLEQGRDLEVTLDVQGKRYR